MNTNPEDILNKVNEVRLTDTERATMRGHIRAFMYEHPARASFLMRISGHFLSAFQPAASPHFLSGYRTGLVALLLVLVTGVGTSYSAENSLPGDTLYPVKINVNEKIEGSLATSPQAKVQLDAVIANRRLVEAEKLASEGKLTTENGATVQTQLAVATTHFDEDVAALASTTDESASSTTITRTQSDLDYSLSAHADTLAAIASSTKTGDDQVTPLIARLRAHKRLKQKTDESVSTSSPSIIPHQIQIPSDSERRDD